MDPDYLYLVYRNKPIEEIVKICQLNSEYYRLCQTSEFWERLINISFGLVVTNVDKHDYTFLHRIHNLYYPEDPELLQLALEMRSAAIESFLNREKKEFYLFEQGLIVQDEEGKYDPIKGVIVEASSYEEAVLIYGDLIREEWYYRLSLEYGDLIHNYDKLSIVTIEEAAEKYLPELKPYIDYLIKIDEDEGDEEVSSDVLKLWQYVDLEGGRDPDLKFILAKTDSPGILLSRFIMENTILEIYNQDDLSDDDKIWNIEDELAGLIYADMFKIVSYDYRIVGLIPT